MAQPDGGVATARASGVGGSRRSRVLLFAGLSLLLTLALVVVDIVALDFNPARAFSPHYYMALGDSLTFGYQPNLDFSSGFADDIFNDLHQANGQSEVSAIVNYACAGETTETMILGGCIARYAHKGSYTGAQLTAAADFLSEDKNRGRVSPVTLEIGANDVLPDWDSTTCQPGPSADADLVTMDANLTRVILPTLTKALTTPSGAPSGDLVMLNYYNPFARVCPNSAQFVRMVNDHLLADATQFKIPVVDIYGAFDSGAGMAANICSYTWYCSSYHDFHPTNAGYKVMANAVEQFLGIAGFGPWLGGGGLGGALAIVAPSRDGAQREADWRRPPLM